MPIILDKKMPENIKQSISQKFNIPYIDSYPLSTLPPPLNTHPDIQIHFLSPFIAISAPECFEYYKKILGKNNITLLKGSLVPGDTYPSDTAYNVARVGKRVFLNTNYAEEKIMKYYEENGYTLCHINQGYAKCSMCVASENTVITEDKGVYNTLLKFPDINALYINSGGVKLNCFEYGFIGGASGLVGDTICFSGKAPKAVTDFLDKLNIKYFECSDLRLEDFGSIIYRR